MKRKHPNGQYTLGFKREVLAWLAADRTRTAGDAGREYDIPPKAPRVWARKAGQTVISSREKIATAPPKQIKTEPISTRARPSNGRPISRRARGTRPGVDHLAADERARLVSTVQDLSTVVEVGASMMADHLRAVQKWEKTRDRSEDEGERPVLGFRLERDTCGALLSVAKTASQLCDTYPGLMSVAGVKEKTEAGTRNLDRVAKALGLK